MADDIKKYGLIGFPLTHSFSPSYFAQKFERESIDDAEYHAYELKFLAELKPILASGIDGFNVTLPYKESIISLLDGIKHSAKAVQTVNTVKRVGDKYIGYNTDVIGFEKSLVNFIEGTAVNKALILGSGGASKAVAYVLDKLEISHLVVSRTKGDVQYENLKDKDIQEAKLVINTTPLGMYPNLLHCPNINFNLINSDHYLYDLIYNPEKTLFLERGAERGAKIKNGLEMLHLQAEAAWEIWKEI